MSFLNKFKKQESVSNSALETCVFALSITDLQTLHFGHWSFYQCDYGNLFTHTKMEFAPYKCIVLLL